MSNIQKLADRLREIEAGEKASEFSKLLWKPKEGLQTVRIVPYKFNPDSPFIELKFYYKVGGKNYLAPCTFGKPDPILEAIEALRASGSNEEKEIANKLSPVTRTYAPVIVRGEEELGVRFWGFGVQVYKQLLKLMTNPDWGNIDSLTDGTDLDVEFHKESKKKNSKGQSFPETNIVPKRNKSYVVDPTRRDLMEKIKDQVDILTIFPLKSYDELKEAVEKWLNPSDATVTPDPAPTAPDTTDVPAGSATTVVTPANTSATPTPTAVGNSAALAEEFAKLFNS